MKSNNGCMKGIINLQKYFEAKLNYLNNRQHAIWAVQTLARQIKILSNPRNTLCAFLDCADCPKYLFFKNLEQQGFYKEVEA